MQSLPEIRYAASGDVSIAYAVLSDGPVDVAYVHGFAGNIDAELENPYFRPFYERIASFSRLIVFDRRGTGLSDRMREAPTLETRMDDLRAVLDAAGSDRAALFGTFEAGSMCLLFAATYRSGCSRSSSTTRWRKEHGRPTIRGLNRRCN